MLEKKWLFKGQPFYLFVIDDCNCDTRIECICIGCKQALPLPAAAANYAIYAADF